MRTDTLTAVQASYLACLRAGRTDQAAFAARRLATLHRGAALRTANPERREAHQTLAEHYKARAIALRPALAARFSF